MIQRYLRFLAVVLLTASPCLAQWHGGGWQGAQGSITDPTPQPTFSYVAPTPDPRIPPTPAPTATAQPAPTAVSTSTPQPAPTAVATSTPQPAPTTIVPITESEVTDLPSHLADLAAGQAGSGSPGNVGSALGQGCGIALRSTSAYVFDLPQCTFTVQGVTYTAPLTTGVTLTAAHATLDRVDIAVANVGSPATQSIITGTPATNPSEPPYDGLTQLRIGSIQVTHNTTAPVGATNETIFDEGEWTVTPGAGWSCTDTTNPQNGSKDCKATAVAANAYTKFVRSSTLSLTGYQQLNAYFYPFGSSTWGSKRSAVLSFRDANDVLVGQPVIITDKSYGFSTSSTTKQLLVIPTAQFAIPSTAVVKAFRIDPQGTGGTFSFYVDNVVLQSTTNSTPIQGITMDQALATFLRFTPTPDPRIPPTPQPTFAYVVPTPVSTPTPAATATPQATPTVVATKYWLPAAACQNATAGLLWDTPTSAPAVGACITGTNTQKGVADFAASSNLSLQITLQLPANYNSSGTVSATFTWLTSTTSGNVVWNLATVCTPTGATATDDPAFNTADAAATTAAPGTANRVTASAISTVTMTGCAASNVLHLKASRNAGAGSDTMSGTARLIGVELTVPRT